MHIDISETEGRIEMLEVATLVLALIGVLSIFAGWTDLDLAPGLEFGKPSAWDFMFSYLSMGGYYRICAPIACAVMGVSILPIFLRRKRPEYRTAISAGILALDLLCVLLVYWFLSWNTGWLAYTVVLKDRMLAGAYVFVTVLALSLILNTSIMLASWKISGFKKLPTRAVTVTAVILVAVLCISYAEYLRVEQEEKAPHIDDNYELSYLEVMAYPELLSDSSAIAVTDVSELSRLHDSTIWLKDPDKKYTQITDYSVTDGLPGSLVPKGIYPYSVSYGGISSTVYAITSTNDLSVDSTLPYTVTVDDSTYRYTFDMVSDGNITLSGYLTGGITVILNGHKLDLELTDVEIVGTTGVPLEIKGDGSVALTVAGDNRITDYRSSSESESPYAIRCKPALNIGGDGNLSIFSGNHGGIRSKTGIDIDGPSVTVESWKDCMRTRGGITLATGSFDLISHHKDGIRCGGSLFVNDGTSVRIRCADDGIRCRGDAVFSENTTVSISTDRYSPYTAGAPELLSSGTYDRNATKGHSCKGIMVKGHLTILGGTYEIDSRDDGMHAGKDITVLDGAFRICSGDDSIHSDMSITIDAGTFSIRSYEGIEGTGITFNGGDYEIFTEDDGINNGSSDRGIMTVNGGRFYINARGDGFDSNLERKGIGVIFNGGQLVIDAPGGAAAVDTERGYTYNGGHVLMVCRPSVASMQSTYCNDSGQFSFVCTTPGNGYVTATDGNVSVTYALSVEVPCLFIALGMGSEADISVSGSTADNLDENGICWHI